MSAQGYHLLMAGFDKAVTVHMVDEGSRLYVYPGPHDKGPSIVYAIATTSAAEVSTRRIVAARA